MTEEQLSTPMAEKAGTLFLQGYNCSQAVFGAFAEQLNLPQQTALKLAAPFGGGIGRLREVCGACSGMLMVLGLAKGYETPETGKIKAAHYETVRALCHEFEIENGSIICREMLQNFEIGGTPEKRTPSYYQKRPCLLCVKSAAAIIEKHLAENP